MHNILGSCFIPFVSFLSDSMDAFWQQNLLTYLSSSLIVVLMRFLPDWSNGPPRRGATRPDGLCERDVIGGACDHPQ